MKKNPCSAITKEGTPCQVPAVKAVVESVGPTVVRSYCLLHAKAATSAIYQRTGSWPTAWGL